jgi:carboxymethylenebutenolidase
MTGKSIAINDKGFNGYLATNDEPNGSGILLIQEIFGVNSHIREVADLWAHAGYTVLAPDVFWRQQPGVELGYGPDDMQKGMGLATKLDQQQVVADFQEAIAKLRSLPGCKGKIAAIGYCMGGTFAYVLAANGSVDAAVCYYGGWIAQMLDMAKNIHCPVMMHFGAKDAHIPLSDVDKISDALDGKKHVEVLVYDADHGFNCDQRASYDRKSAMLAFGRSMVMLDSVCRP